MHPTSNDEKIPWNCIHLKISFEKFSIGNTRSPPFNAVFSRKIIVVQPCYRALHIIYGKLLIYNSDNTLDLLYNIFGPAYFNNLSAKTSKKRSAFLLRKPQLIFMYQCLTQYILYLYIYINIICMYVCITYIHVLYACTCIYLSICLFIYQRLPVL